jgi:hypothetical protein
MDLLEKQKERRTRGLVVICLAVIVLASTLWLMNSHQIPVMDFAVIYFSGIPLGAGIAIVVASYKVTREIAGK